MITKKNKNQIRQVRHTRLRKNLSGTASCPRLNVYRLVSFPFIEIRRIFLLQRLFLICYNETNWRWLYEAHEMVQRQSFLSGLAQKL